MKTRIFLVAAALMMLASMSFGQGFIACLYTADDAGNVVTLYNNCDDTGGPVACGTSCLIYWDANNNGPDAADVQPPVGDLAGEVNFNSWPMDCNLGDGTFATDPCFVSVGILPANPHYYVVIQTPTSRLTSSVFTLISGPNEVYLSQWACEPTGNPCVPENGTIYTSVGSNEYDGQVLCVGLCVDHTSVAKICHSDGSPFDPTKTPVGTWGSDCPNPGSGVPGDWYIDTDGCWTSVVVGVTEGCYCFTFDHFLAASVESFSGAIGDNSVSLTWVTASETNLASFSVLRDGEMIASVPAANSPTGNTYTYTDNTARNGHTYNYGLRMVDNNGSVTEVAQTVTATPSFGAAVVTEYALLQNFPNPFNPTTEIAFDVLNSNNVTLKVYNAAGQQVATLVNGARYEGGKRYVVSFDATNLTSGLYFYTVKIGNEFSATKKMLLVK